MEDSLIKVALLNWVRGYYATNKDKSQVEMNEKTMKVLEEFLIERGIIDLRIIHQSNEYYTLSFKLYGEHRIKQYTTEEVEKHL